MTVKELIASLEKSEQEYEVYCSMAEDDIFDAYKILEIIEAKTLGAKEGMECSINGVYIRLE